MTSWNHRFDLPEAVVLGLQGGELPFDQLCSTMLDERMSTLPTRQRTIISRSDVSAGAALGFAEAAWDVVIELMGTLCSLSSAGLVRDVAYGLAASKLDPNTKRTPRTSLAPQALVGLAFGFARSTGWGQPGVLDDRDVRAALLILQELATLATAAGTAGELASSSPPLAMIQITRSEGRLPLLDLSPTEWFNPHEWNRSMDKRGTHTTLDGITELFHTELGKLFGESPSHFDQLDEAVLVSQGFRLVDIFVVLQEAMESCPDLDDHSPRAARVLDLVDAVSADGEVERRRAAIDALTWRIEEWDWMWRPWNIQDATLRLGVRPFLPMNTKLGPAVIMAPGVARAAGAVWNDRLAEGIWPLRRLDGRDDGGVREPQGVLTQAIDKVFEEEVARMLRRGGLAWGDIEVGVATEAALLGSGTTRLVEGDIDVLALDRCHKRVLVLEVKHPDLKLRPRHAGMLLAKTFLGTRGRMSDVDKAARRVERVRHELPSILRHRGVNDVESWRVVGALVTTLGSPMTAWRPRTPLPIVLLEEIGEWMRDDREIHTS